MDSNMTHVKVLTIVLRVREIRYTILRVIESPVPYKKVFV